ncbi:MULTISPECIES: fimbrial protein [Erwinia]|uniref:fimbrial protein n=1 Tax=Erwinia TaxID=551 RepID=UPI001414D9E9|nr:fimbrial protein [Erwinia aphidicola]MCP2231014.1 type 1 fimbria pilin [Erwinia aphidicola]
MYRYIYFPAPEPIYRLYTEEFVVPVPVECRINNGTLINVPFGNVDSSLLTSSASTSPYHVERALSYKCNTSLSQDIKVVLAAAPAGFSDAVKTSNKDIGVVMLYKNQPVPPNGSYTTTLVNGTGSDAVSFNVVKRGGTSPATGPFTGSGTLIVSSL